MSDIKFGTDGWRAVIAEDFTFENVRLVAQATAEWLKRDGQAAKGVVVGYDMRFLSGSFASAVAEVMADQPLRYQHDGRTDMCEQGVVATTFQRLGARPIPLNEFPFGRAFQENLD